MELGVEETEQAHAICSGIGFGAGVVASVILFKRTSSPTPSLL